MNDRLYRSVDDRVIAELKAAGVTVCPTAIRPSAEAGFNRPGTSPFHLYRTMVGFMGQPFPIPGYAPRTDGLPDGPQAGTMSRP